MPNIALTPGCPAGIGPELFPLALQKANIDKGTSLTWCGSAALFERHCQSWSIPVARREQTIFMDGANTKLAIFCTVNDDNDPALGVSPGHPDDRALSAQKMALLEAIRLAEQNKIDAMVTGPVRKAALLDVNGISFPGQTELLHHYLAADQDPPLMCFAGYEFLLGLATIHVPIKRVAGEITQARLEQQIKRLIEAASTLLQLAPSAIRVSVLGLNPHAGENGLIGDEELKIISPTIGALRKNGLHVEGPLPADGFFGNLYRTPVDQLPHAVLAMMHDQGLGPYKLLCRGGVANITFGLKIPRVSPAHGTADDIAGKKLASPDSLIEAIELASRLIREPRR